MVIKRKKEKKGGYAVGISEEVYKMLEDVRNNMDQKMSLQALATELLKEAISNIEWSDDDPTEEKEVPIDVLMRERI